MYEHLGRLTGPIGPIRGVRVVSIDADDFEDARGFMWQANAGGTYLYRPLGAPADLTADLQAGGYPALCDVPVACEAVRAATGLSILVGYP